MNENGKAILEPDLMTFAAWFEKADRTVAKTNIGDALVSTVFLGLDHGFDKSGPPVLWETMVFWAGHDMDGAQDRYASREAAMAGHESMVSEVRKNRLLESTEPKQILPDIGD